MKIINKISRNIGKRYIQKLNKSEYKNSYFTELNERIVEFAFLF